jgi:hypothetical protein
MKTIASAATVCRVASLIWVGIGAVQCFDSALDVWRGHVAQEAELRWGSVLMTFVWLAVITGGAGLGLKRSWASIALIVALPIACVVVIGWLSFCLLEHTDLLFFVYYVMVLALAFGTWLYCVYGLAKQCVRARVQREQPR